MPVALAHSDVFHAIADPTRRAVIRSLLPPGAERTAGSLGEGFASAQATISQHLRVLRDAGLVSAREVGRQRLYRLEAKPLQEIHAWVDGVLNFEDPAGHVWRVQSHRKED